MTDYTKLDAAILALIACRPVTFTSILHAPGVRAQAKLLAEANPKKPILRFIDSRLQALRKRGLIQHSGKTGWNAVEQPAADKPEAAH